MHGKRIKIEIYIAATINSLLSFRKFSLDVKEENKERILSLFPLSTGAMQAMQLHMGH